MTDQTNKELENPATTEDTTDETAIDENLPTKTPTNVGPGQATVAENFSTSNPFFLREYEILKK